MSSIKKHAKETPPEFKVGDAVSFAFGNDWLSGKVVEDRGCLGIGGRRLYGIKFEINPGEDAYVEAPAAYLSAGATVMEHPVHEQRSRPHKNGAATPSPPLTVAQLLNLARKLPAAERSALLARLGAELPKLAQIELLARVMARLPSQALRALEEELTARVGARAE